VEHDTLTLLLDLILLKRDVYRHLLFNRGAEPRQAEPSKAVGKQTAGKADKALRSGTRETVCFFIFRLSLANH
jgi:lipid intermediate transporter